MLQAYDIVLQRIAIATFVHNITNSLLQKYSLHRMSVNTNY